MKKFLVFALLVAVGCSSTSIVSSWKDPSATVNPEKLSKVMVAALVKDEGTRRIAEDKMASFNKSFLVSYNEFSSKEVMDNEDKCRAILKDQGFDGIITMQLLDKEKSQNYVPGNYAGGYWGFHRLYYPGYYRPGYYTEETKFIIETNVFSLKQNKLIWSGVTATVNPSTIDKTVAEVLEQVHKRMIKDKFITQ